MCECRDRQRSCLEGVCPCFRRGIVCQRNCRCLTDLCRATRHRSGEVATPTVPVDLFQRMTEVIEKLDQRLSAVERPRATEKEVMLDGPSQLVVVPQVVSTVVSEGAVEPPGAAMHVVHREQPVEPRAVEGPSATTSTVTTVSTTSVVPLLATIPEVAEQLSGITIASSKSIAELMRDEKPALFDKHWDRVMFYPDRYHLTRYGGDVGDVRVIEWLRTTQKRLQVCKVPYNQWRHIVPTLFEGRAEVLVSELDESMMPTYSVMQNAILKKLRVVTDSLAEEALRLPWNPETTSMTAYYDGKCQYGMMA